MSDLLKIASFTNFKALDDADENYIYIEGMASTTDKDRDGEIVAISGMDISAYKKNPIVLFGHDHNQPIGKVLEIEKKDNGLWVKAAISKAAEKVVTLIQQGILKTFSIGFRVLDYSWSDSLESWILEKSELFEVSTVAVPANSGAIFEQVKSYGETHNFKKPSTDNVPNKSTKEIDMTLEEMQAKMKEMEDSLKAEKDEKARLLKEKEQKELEEKMAKEKAEKEALKTEIKGVDEKVSKVTELIESITESVKSLTEEIETLKTSKPRIESVPASEETVRYFMEDYKDAYACSLLFNKDFKDTIKFSGMSERAKSISIDSAFLQLVQENWQKDVRAKSAIFTLFKEIPFKTTSDIVPYAPGTTSSWGSVSENDWATTPVTCTAYSIFSYASFNYVTDEEAIIDWLPMLRADISEAIADGIDAAVIDDDPTHSNTFAGVADWANGASYTNVVTTDGAVEVADIDAARALMGKYGVKAGDCVLALHPTAYLDLVQDENVSTVDKYGANATILNGELAKVRGIPIVVNEAVPYSASTSSAVVGVLFNRKMFFTKMGSFLLEFDKTITTQKSNIVGSMRVGFIPSKPLNAGEIDGPFAYNLVNAA